MTPNDLVVAVMLAGLIGSLAFYAHRLRRSLDSAVADGPKSSSPKESKKVAEPVTPEEALVTLVEAGRIAQEASDRLLVNVAGKVELSDVAKTHLHVRVHKGQAFRGRYSQLKHGKGLSKSDTGKLIRRRTAEQN